MGLCTISRIGSILCRSSADAAGHDADLASQAAQEAYNIAWEKQLHEQEQYRAAAAEGELKSNKTSLLDAIKQQVGQDALDLLLDLIGVKDVLDCFKGEVSACLWAAAGALPLGKIAKLGKAIPVIKKLIGKIDNIKDAVRNSRFGSKLDNVLHPASCVRGRPATWSGTATFQQAAWRPSTLSEGSVWRTVVNICSLQIVNGRKPINWRYAGGKWRDGDPARMPKDWKHGDIYFSDRGFPQFSHKVEPISGPMKYDPKRMPTPGKAEVIIKPQSNSKADMLAADKILGIDEEYRRANNLVWHHHEEYGRMQLIPADLHRAVRHTGGAAIWQN